MYELKMHDHLAYKDEYNQGFVILLCILVESAVSLHERIEKVEIEVG